MQHRNFFERESNRIPTDLRLCLGDIGAHKRVERGVGVHDPDLRRYARLQTLSDLHKPARQHERLAAARYTAHQARPAIHAQVDELLLLRADQ